MSVRWHFHGWAWARRTTAVLFIVLLWLAGRGWFPWFSGSLTGTRLLDFVVFTDRKEDVVVGAGAGSLVSPGILWLEKEIVER